jgi:hypothetical protein
LHLLKWPSGIHTLMLPGSVVVAVIFPVLSGFVRQEFKATAAIGLPPWMKKYGALLCSV